MVVALAVIVVRVVTGVLAIVVVVAAVIAEARLVVCEGMKAAAAVGVIAVEVNVAVIMVVEPKTRFPFVVPLAVVMVMSTAAAVKADVAKAVLAEGTLAPAVLVAAATGTTDVVPLLWASKFGRHSTPPVCTLVPLSLAVASRVVLTSGTSCFTASILKLAVVSMVVVAVFILDLLAATIDSDISTVVPVTIEVTNPLA